ncbi:MAG: hypothetical protein LW711_06550 [Saprospiraceae bacterium]|jgi:hypothetical protein|nr:hypothetical protein [Saprospiraceae bacterium]
MSGMNEKKQVKSKKRVADHGEVFTNEREVNAMLDLVKHETERIDSRFLEPACGNGNFLAEVLRRKLKVVDQRYGNNQMDWERYAVIGVSSIYGVDILEDNAKECRERLYTIFDDFYTALFMDKCKEECRRSIRFLFDRNILWGDALDFTNKDDYRINLIKGKTFSGYHILAYFYVSWSLAIPELVSQINLPYETEFKMALAMHKPNK